ncbi:MAG TPA: glycosyltransferase family 4 protein [Candidatus Binatia bacterium]|nr:glycosyltransferase family 4 protein [Candidatus Binatia bacterium]
MRRVAYLFPLFPVINQTFTLAEVVWLKRRGYDIRLFSLLSRVDPGLQQAQGKELIEETHYCPGYGSAGLWGPLWRGFRKSPAGVLALFATVFQAWRQHVPTRRGQGPAPDTFTLAEWFDVLWRGNRWFYLMKNWMMVPHALYLAEVFEREGIPHVHCHWATYPATVGMLIKQWAGIPFSVTAHAYDIHMMPWMLTAKLEAADFFVTCADYNRRYLSSVCSPEAASRIFLNYHGTDLERFQGGPRREGKEFRVVSVGWLKEYKGFHVIVEAIALLAQRGVDAVFHLAGDGPQRGYLEAQAKRLGIEERVVFHGYLDHGRLVGLYRDCDVFAMGSIEMTNFGRQDVIPNVIAEAMAVGLPIVATRMGGIAELVEEGVSGLMIPQRDPAAMADALEKIASDPQLAARLRAEAHAKVRRIWDRNRNLEELASLFNERIRAVADEAAA